MELLRFLKFNCSLTFDIWGWYDMIDMISFLICVMNFSSIIFRSNKLLGISLFKFQLLMWIFKVQGPETFEMKCSIQGILYSNSTYAQTDGPA